MSTRNIAIIVAILVVLAIGAWTMGWFATDTAMEAPPAAPATTEAPPATDAPAPAAGPTDADDITPEPEPAPQQ